PSGSAFVVWGDAQDAAARLVLSANSMRTQLPNDRRRAVAAVMSTARGSVTGNLILNEVAGSDNLSVSLVVGPPLAEVAVTGNTMRGIPALPPHAGVPAPLDRWEPLNLIVTS